MYLSSLAEARQHLKGGAKISYVIGPPNRRSDRHVDLQHGIHTSKFVEDEAEESSSWCYKIMSMMIKMSMLITTRLSPNYAKSYKAG
jgi:hypothetical protein